jgi:glycosyltransferase involved in cell wall biosynthesis
MTAPKVVMMVGNDIAHDTRVLKMGLTLADAGLDVTLLGWASSGVREERQLGPVRILRVPVGFRLRDASIARRKERRTAGLSLALDPARRRAQNLEASVRRREAESGQGVGAKVRYQRMRVNRLTARIRAGADRRLQKQRTQAWRAFDGAMDRNPVGASWRSILPEIDDYELSFGPVLDQLDWDVLHAHDVHLVGVAARAVARRRAEGRTAEWVYDAHEYVRGLSIYGPRTVRRRAAYLDLEREYIRSARAVVTVTDQLASRLKADYRLPVLPAVVMNSPTLGSVDLPLEANIREQLGIADDVTLAVYSGGVTAVRGIDTAINALPELPGVHVAVVAVPGPHTGAAQSLARLATRLGVADRVHLLKPVPPAEVPAFLRGSDVGLIPLHHFGSHEVAIANKVFEYLHAGIPLLVSDCEAQQEFVETLHVGEVHAAADVPSFVAAFRRLQERLPEVKARIASDPGLLEPFGWDRQEAVLRGVYREILGAAVHEPTTVTPLEEVREQPVVRTDRPSYVGIGPANMAGQAWAWAKALERDDASVRTEVMSVDRGSPLTFAADDLVPAATYANDPAWAQRFETHVLETWTHALLEAGRPLLGLRHGRDFTGDVPVLRAVGIEVGLLFHGSELRNPAGHAARNPFSPFADPEEEMTARLQKQWDVLHPLFVAFDGPKAVSTPDLLLDLPGAVWLPVVVDVDRWASDAPVLEREIPIVLHAPSRAAIKGTRFVEAAMAPLVAEGLIDFRLVEGVTPDEMPALIGSADIVLDQFALGSYGVATAEALASGRLVVSHVTEQVRAALPEPLPVVEADPGTLTEVLRDVLADREAARALAGRGPAYVRAVHDGRLSARVLREHFGIRGA